MKRLPKTARHWVERAGFKLSWTENWRDGVYASSKSLMHTADCRDDRRHIRLLPEAGIMQICDGYFDRWANSVGAVVPLPRTQREFTLALTKLLSEAKLSEQAA